MAETAAQLAPGATPIDRSPKGERLLLHAGSSLCAAWDGYQVLGWDDARPRAWLITDSATPSGLGTHLLALANGLKPWFSVTVAAPRSSGLLACAERIGVPAVPIEPERINLMAHLLTCEAPDLIHVHAGIGWEGHQLAAAARRAKVPVVVRTDHLPFLLTDPAQQLQYQSGLSLVDRLICVGWESAETYARAGVSRDKMSVVRNGVPTANALHAPAKIRAALRLGDGPLVLMAGRFTHQKGHDLLLDAWPRVLQAHPSATLLLCGDGPLFHAVAEQASHRCIRRSVKLLGHRSDVADLMGACDLLVLPSRFEGLPLVALEAMASGLPIVATDVAGNAETVTDGVTGWLCRAGDSEEFGQAITDALSDRRWLARAGRAARALYEREFTAKRMIAETLGVYRQAGLSIVETEGVA